MEKQTARRDGLRVQTELLVRALGKNFFVPVTASLGNRTVQACDLVTESRAVAFVQRTLQDHAQYFGIHPAMKLGITKTTFAAGDRADLFNPKNAKVHDLSEGAEAGPKQFLNEICFEKPDGSWNCVTWICDDT